MEKNYILITGATGAIGKATATALAKDGHPLILMGRDAGKLAAAKAEITKATGNDQIDTVVADLSEPDTIRHAAAEIKKSHTALHALINIVAVFSSKRKENSKGYEFMFATNHLGPFILTSELLDLLKAGKPARVITVSAPSTTKVNFEDIHGVQKFSAGFMGAFGASKMMNLLFTYALARRLEGTGVTTTVYHPGLVKSELTKEMPAFLNFIFKSMSAPPERAAGMLARLATDKAYEASNGKFFKFNGKELKSSKYSYDESVQERLWKMSEEMMGLR